MFIEIFDEDLDDVIINCNEIRYITTSFRRLSNSDGRITGDVGSINFRMTEDGNFCENFLRKEDWADRLREIKRLLKVE